MLVSSLSYTLNVSSYTLILKVSLLILIIIVSSLNSVVNVNSPFLSVYVFNLLQVFMLVHLTLVFFLLNKKNIKTNFFINSFV